MEEALHVFAAVPDEAVADADAGEYAPKAPPGDGGAVDSEYLCHLLGGQEVLVHFCALSAHLCCCSSTCYRESTTFGNPLLLCT